MVETRPSARDVLDLAQWQKAAARDQRAHSDRVVPQKGHLLANLCRNFAYAEAVSGHYCNQDIRRGLLGTLFHVVVDRACRFLASAEHHSSEAGGAGGVGVEAEGYRLEVPVQAAILPNISGILQGRFRQVYG